MKRSWNDERKVHQRLLLLDGETYEILLLLQIHQLSICVGGADDDDYDDCVHDSLPRLLDVSEEQERPRQQPRAQQRVAFGVSTSRSIVVVADDVHVVDAEMPLVRRLLQLRCEWLLLERCEWVLLEYEAAASYR